MRIPLRSRKFAPLLARLSLPLTACLLLVVAGGCASSEGWSDVNGVSSRRAQVHSFQRDGEQVVLRLISHERWNAEYKGKLLDGNNRPIELPPELPAVEPKNATLFRMIPGVDAAVGAVVGVLVDAVKAGIEKEAARHEQQFTQSVYADDFYKGPGQGRYAAFEVVRTAAGFDESKPAFRCVCAIVPSRHDRRIFLLKPVYLKVNGAAAKVSRTWSGHTTMTIKLNTILQGAKVKDDGTLEQPSLADATFTWPGYDLSTSPTLAASFDSGSNSWTGELRDATAGYFLAPSPYSDAKVASDAANAASSVAKAEGALADAQAEVARPNATADEKASAALAAAEKELAAARRDFESKRERWVAASSGGAFRLYTAVTETDDSKAKATLLKFAEFVGSQKDDLVKSAKDAVGGSKTPGK